MTARIHAATAALQRLEELAGEDWTREDTVKRVRGQFEYRRRRFVAAATTTARRGFEEQSVAYQRLVRELLEAQRSSVVGLRNDGVISNEVMSQIERELDLEDSRLEI